MTLAIDLRALRSRPGTRVTCAECGEEVINERELVRGGAPLCWGCAGETYYRVWALGMPRAGSLRAADDRGDLPIQLG